MWGLLPVGVGQDVVVGVAYAPAADVGRRAVHRRNRRAVDQAVDERRRGILKNLLDSAGELDWSAGSNCDSPSRSRIQFLICCAFALVLPQLARRVNVPNAPHHLTCDIDSSGLNGQRRPDDHSPVLHCHFHPVTILKRKRESWRQPAMLDSLRRKTRHVDAAMKQSRWWGLRNNSASTCSWFFSSLPGIQASGRRKRRSRHE